MSADNYEECGAWIAGGCGACEKCDPEWWARLKDGRCHETGLGECLTHDKATGPDGRCVIGRGGEWQPAEGSR